MQGKLNNVFSGIMNKKDPSNSRSKKIDIHHDDSDRQTTKGTENCKSIKNNIMIINFVANRNNK
jgi:hypothetical protein